jgi:hypothetical protein
VFRFFFAGECIFFKLTSRVINTLCLKISSNLLLNVLMSFKIQKLIVSSKHSNINRNYLDLSKIFFKEKFCQQTYFATAKMCTLFINHHNSLSTVMSRVHVKLSIIFFLGCTKHTKGNYDTI